MLDATTEDNTIQSATPKHWSSGYEAVIVYRALEAMQLFVYVDHIDLYLHGYRGLSLRGLFIAFCEPGSKAHVVLSFSVFPIPPLWTLLYVIHLTSIETLPGIFGFLAFETKFIYSL